MTMKISNSKMNIQTKRRKTIINSRKLKQINIQMKSNYKMMDGILLKRKEDDNICIIMIYNVVYIISFKFY